MSVRMLIVDDDPSIRRALSTSLARVGFDVHTAEDGAMAIPLAKLLEPQLALIDFNMPTCGLEVLSHLKARYGAAMFIAMLTGDDDQLTRDKCFAAGADAVLSKPILPSELRRLMMAAASGIGITAAAS
jgi:two-component system OmpR family response regulator